MGKISLKIEPYFHFFDTADFSFYLFLSQGVKCKWSRNDFLEVDLRYCNSPVTYHVHFKQDNTEKNFTLKQQDEKVLYTRKSLGTFKIKVNKLIRSGNTVTTNVRLTSVLDCL